MSTSATETLPSGTVISLENLLFDYPEADVVLRSRDAYEFRVLKLYIVHSSPILGEKLLLSLKPQLDPNSSVVSAESDVKGTTVNASCAVQLPVDGAILLSLLNSVPPILPQSRARHGTPFSCSNVQDGRRPDSHQEPHRSAGTAIHPGRNRVPYLLSCLETWYSSKGSPSSAMHVNFFKFDYRGSGQGGQARPDARHFSS